MTREQYLAQRQQLMAQAKGFLEAGNIDQFNATKKAVEDLDNKYEAEATAQANFAALQNSAVIPAVLQNIGAGNPGVSNLGTAPSDRFDSDEYKLAFMNYACRNVPIPEKFRSNEAANTTVTDAAAAIPTSWVNEIIRNLKERGIIFQQLRHLNIQGGVEIPIMDLSPVATWTNGGGSEDQKADAKESVSFKYYGLECKISQDILTSVTTIEAFQALFVPLATEAVIAAVEKGVFTGTGNGQMLGIFNDPRVTNIVELTDEEFAQWASWKKKVFALIPKKYQGGKFFMAQGTFEGHIDGMVDKNGQPIGRTNYGLGTAPSYHFGGKKVETVEDDVIPSYDVAAPGSYVAAYLNLKNYIFNSNMKMTVVTWTDNDNNKKKTKVMMVCDGRIGDANGVILIKKKAAV